MVVPKVHSDWVGGCTRKLDSSKLTRGRTYGTRNVEGLNKQQAYRQTLESPNRPLFFREINKTTFF